MPSDLLEQFWQIISRYIAYHGKTEVQMTHSSPLGTRRAPVSIEGYIAISFLLLV
jgi:hypothetical protein